MAAVSTPTASASVQPLSVETDQYTSIGDYIPKPVETPSSKSMSERVVKVDSPSEVRRNIFLFLTAFVVFLGVLALLCLLL